MFVLGSPVLGRVGQWDTCSLRQYSFVLNAITYYNGGLLGISEAYLKLFRSRCLKSTHSYMEGIRTHQNGWYSGAYNGGDDFIPDGDISVVR